MKGRTQHSESLVVAGLDPGLANMGLGAIRRSGRDTALLGCELVRTDASMAQGERLIHLYSRVRQFLRLHRPDALAVEGQYFHRQLGVAFKVGQALGVCLLAAQEEDVAIFEYGPMQVKQALVGTGQANKAQVAYMVRALLSLKETPESHHVADALALALTHLSFRQLQSLTLR
ncbi:MAG: crossover junction endodeoxyribonuclease RuvC [Deinococcota bacterium]|nr:crossover junction endodeoxyribonuclease RuvC [Deinococcota bacterium]